MITGGSEGGTEWWSLREEVFWLVAQIPALAADPALLLPSLMEYLREYISYMITGTYQGDILNAIDLFKH